MGKNCEGECEKEENLEFGRVSKGSVEAFEMEVLDSILEAKETLHNLTAHDLRKLT